MTTAATNVVEKDYVDILTTKNGLPLSGGTMSGPIGFEYGTIVSSDGSLNINSDVLYLGNNEDAGNELHILNPHITISQGSKDCKVDLETNGVLKIDNADREIDVASNTLKLQDVIFNIDDDNDFYIRNYGHCITLKTGQTASQYEDTEIVLDAPKVIVKGDLVVSGEVTAYNTGSGSGISAEEKLANIRTAIQSSISSNGININGNMTAA